MAQRGVEHVDEHRLVARRHQRDVRQAAQVGDVEDAVVRRAVVADQAGAVHREDDGQLLQADVVDDLVVGALQEGRVDRGDRARALERQAGGEQQRLLLGDADVEVAVGHRLLEDVEAGAGVHRRGDADDAAVALGTRATIASPKTCVYCGGGAAAGSGLDGAGHALGDRLRLGGVPLLHALQAAVLGGREALALDGRAWTTTGRSASNASRSARRRARTSWPSTTPM